MDQETKALLEANLELSKENNHLLRKIRGVQKRAQTFRLVYWIFILATVFGAYYYIQPYIEKFIPVIGNTQTQLDNLSKLGNSLNDVTNVNNIIDQVKKK